MIQHSQVAGNFALAGGITKTVNSTDHATQRPHFDSLVSAGAEEAVLIVEHSEWAHTVRVAAEPQQSDLLDVELRGRVADLVLPVAQPVASQVPANANIKVC